MAEISNQNQAHINLLFGEINSESSREVCAWIINANFSESPPPYLTLIVNSAGGDLNDTFAITDIMQSSAIPIRTIGIGQIQSSGLMIFMAGAKGRRTLTHNTSIMSHQYSSESSGKHDELVNVQREFELTNQRMIAHYNQHTGLSVKYIIKHLLGRDDKYLSAEDALRYSICDCIKLTTESMSYSIT